MKGVPHPVRVTPDGAWPHWRTAPAPPLPYSSLAGEKSVAFRASLVALAKMRALV
jgi:hypothetical protein